MESTIEGLKDVETAFEEIAESYDIYNNQFDDSLDLDRFLARKQEYKNLRREAYRWIRMTGAEPKRQQDLERGWYSSVTGEFFHDSVADNPFHWSVQAFRVRRQLERVSATFVAQNLYLINQFMSGP